MSDLVDEDYSQVQIVTCVEVGHCFHDCGLGRYADRLRNEVVAGDLRFQICHESA